METPPTIILGWYNTASKFDNQWKRAQAIAQGLRGGQDQKKTILTTDFKNSGF